MLHLPWQSYCLDFLRYHRVFALFMLIPLRYYNGKRGISLKYVFYAFYPVHLFVLYLICRLAMVAAVHT